MFFAWWLIAALNKTKKQGKFPSSFAFLHVLSNVYCIAFEMVWPVVAEECAYRVITPNQDTSGLKITIDAFRKHKREVDIAESLCTLFTELIEYGKRFRISGAFGQRSKNMSYKNFFSLRRRRWWTQVSQLEIEGRDDGASKNVFFQRGLRLSDL